ncbi:MAG: hypothetical protein V1838_05490 [Patescibacteria group bacterium]
MAVLLIAMPLMISCAKEDGPVSVKQDNPANGVDEQAFADQQAELELFLSWVEQIDPFVSQDKDHTYCVDWDGLNSFVASQKLSNEDSEMIESLKESVALANQRVMAGDPLLSKAEAQSVWTNYYWWGKRTCFTGHQALDYAYVFSGIAIGSSLFGIAGWILKAWAGICLWLYNGCGGYCFVSSWAGGIWITCP